MIRVRNAWAFFAWPELDAPPLPARLRILLPWDRGGVRGVLVESPRPVVALPAGWCAERWAGWAADGGRAVLALPSGLVVEGSPAALAAHAAG